MKPITIRDVLTATGGRLLEGCPDLDREITGVSTDSRTVRPGDLFIPLSGARFDGHAFIADALEKGAAACLTVRSRERYSGEKSYVMVKNAQTALRDLAAWHRRRFPIPCIAVTGSVGKTTCKDMVAATLGTRYRVLKTEGNFNNEIGLPLTLLRLDDDHEMIVLEMGMSDFGEIAYLAAIAEPDAAIVTNIGDAHIESLGSRENILKAKSEIFNYLRPDGTVLLNGDDPLLRPLKDTLPFTVLTCGTDPESDYYATDLESDGVQTLRCTVHMPDALLNVQVGALGSHMVYPILFAAAVGRKFGLSRSELAKGIADFSPTKMRMNILHRQKKITILDDGYNANPQSMRAALEVLAGARGKKKIAVLGDMLELGALAPALHEGVGRYVATADIDVLVTVGEQARHIAAGAGGGRTEIHACQTRDEAKKLLEPMVEPETTVLVKASRGMTFEDITSFLLDITEE
ncbi:MAG: UDP-N-acetylmuramoyl-tripeptide--D-alanyl-D-alanine ligase [Oscillospiraceae bacterium]|nr:UDP-N-acetylmuramoyl-tripeptide--D-alanyl-D-alanine ligase [Oscillospiraceae bacterium]